MNQTKLPFLFTPFSWEHQIKRSCSMWQTFAGFRRPFLMEKYDWQKWTLHFGENCPSGASVILHRRLYSGNFFLMKNELSNKWLVEGSWHHWLHCWCFDGNQEFFKSSNNLIGKWSHDLKESCCHLLLQCLPLAWSFGRKKIEGIIMMSKMSAKG